MVVAAINRSNDPRAPAKNYDDVYKLKFDLFVMQDAEQEEVYETIQL